MKRSLMLLTLFLLVAAMGLFSSDYHPDDFPVTGEAAVAERYAIWAQNLIDQGLWREALAGLERAFDYAGVSSDISYLLALARSNEGMHRASVLDALEFAIQADRWSLYQSDDGRLFKAEQLIALREYPEALFELSLVSESLRRAELTMMALSASRPMEFLNYMNLVLDRYPRDTGPVRIFLAHIKNEEYRGRIPDQAGLALLETISRRLPLLLSDDPELAWMAAPFLWDRDDARRLVLSYRAANEPAPDSIPVALFLGLINEETALDELFSGISMLDISLLGEVWELLENEEAKEIFRRNLSAYSGVITEDWDKDGIKETFAEYRDGVLIQSVYDRAQSGISDLIIYFEAGVAVDARVLIPPEVQRQEALVIWERYPSVLEVDFDEAVFIPRPLDLFYAPVSFVELWGSGVLFPQRDLLSPPLTRRVLVFHSLRIERPSQEFHGGLEVVELNQGIPVRAREFVGEMMVSETEFVRGHPRIQRVDLDFDGRFETVRHFRPIDRPVELEELWNYEREIEFTVSN